MEQRKLTPKVEIQDVPFVVVNPILLFKGSTCDRWEARWTDDETGRLVILLMDQCVTSYPTKWHKWVSKIHEKAWRSK